MKKKYLNNLITIFLIYIFLTNTTINAGKLRKEYINENKIKEVTTKDFISGKKLYKEKLCNTCHGETGKETLVKSYPKIASLPFNYIYQQILDIKENKRKSEDSKIMSPFVENLNKEEIKLISLFLSKQ